MNCNCILLAELSKMLKLERVAVMKDYRPGYHYRSKENWIIDPCGLAEHHGVYHLFHQYNPHGEQWGDMHAQRSEGVQRGSRTVA